MTHDVSITDISRHFSEFLNRVAYKGEHFLLRRGKTVIAELKPAPRGRRLGDLPVLFKSLPRLSDTDAKAFSRDLQKAKRALSRRKLKSPWES